MSVFVNLVFRRLQFVSEASMVNGKMLMGCYFETQKLNQTILHKVCLRPMSYISISRLDEYLYSYLFEVP